jgi:hypothetical protein
MTRDDVITYIAVPPLLVALLIFSIPVTAIVVTLRRLGRWDNIDR